MVSSLTAGTVRGLGGGGSRLGRAKVAIVLRTASFSVAFGIVFALCVHVIIPRLLAVTDVTPFIVTQVTTTLLVFMPIFVTTFALLRRDGVPLDWPSVEARLRFRRISPTDLAWMVGALAAGAALTVLVLQVVHWLPFLDAIALDSLAPYELRPLVGFERLFILFMVVVFFFNYVGEEILWRGYLYPIQELALGRFTWLVNGALHAVFHMFMGWAAIAFMPMFLAFAFVFKKTKNVSVVILMHFLLGAPTDFLLAMGVIS